MSSSSHAHQVLDEIAPELDAHPSGRAATLVLRELAERQYGVVAHGQLSAAGMGEGLIQHRIASGLFIPIHRGVYALGHRVLSRRARWLAAVLASGPDAVLSHSSAAELWDIRGGGWRPEVTRRSGGSPRGGIVVHQTRMLEHAEIAEKDRIPVTSIERTLLDVAARLDDRQAERALVAADRTGKLRWQELDRLIARTPRRRGAPRLRQAMLAVDPAAVHAMSPLEIDFLTLCKREGLPSPQVNVLVEGLLVDFLWSRERVVVETDGYVYHAGQPAFERDHVRTARLEAHGYAVHRATYRMLTDEPESFIELVRASLRRPR